MIASKYRIPAFANYLLSFFLAFLAVYLRYLLIPVFGTRTMFLTLYPIIMIVTFAFGTIPGLLSCVFGIFMTHAMFFDSVWHWLAHPPEILESSFVLISTVGLVCVARHLHERRRLAERAQQDSESGLHLALQAANAGYWVWDIETNGCVWSDEVWELYGYRQGEVLPSLNAWEQSIHPEDRVSVIEHFRQAALKGTNVRIEWRVYRPDGITQWLMSRGQPVVSEKNRLRKFMGIVIDITDRKRMEAALSQSENRFRLQSYTAGRLLAADDPLQQLRELCHEVMSVLELDVFFNYIHDRTTGRLRLNAYAGIPDAAAQKISWLDFGAAICGHVASKGEHLIAESLVTNLDPRADLVRSYGVMAYCCHPLKVQGKVIGTLSFGTKKRLRFSAEEVEVMRTVADHIAIAMHRLQVQEDLKKAKLDAEAANFAKSQFLAMMSHEIRTPLNAIIGFSELCNQTDYSPQERLMFLDRIRHNGQTVAHLIDDILDLSKIEAGKLQIEKIAVDLNEIISETAAIMQTLAEKRGIDFVIRIETPLPHSTLIDPIRFKQILVNIIGNAIKFTASGSVSAVFGLDSHTNRLRVTVTDTGEGIDPEQAIKLFHPFTQADNSTTRRFGGTGLGLVLSRRLARALGGDVRLLHSAPREGSVFEIEVALEPADDRLDRTIRETAISTGTTRLDGLHILLAEDMQDNQLLYSKILSLAGAKIDLADDGRQAVSKALSGDYDIVLMDIQMPKLDGYGATAMLRSQGYSRPIIALTAHAMREEVERSIQSGCNGHMAKPMQRKDLIDTIYRYTRGGMHKGNMIPPSDYSPPIPHPGDLPMLL